MNSSLPSDCQHNYLKMSHICSNKRKLHSKNRLKEMELFRKTFSRLPQDIQMYISEFLPNIFSVTRLTATIIRDRKFACDYNSLTKYSCITKDDWNRIYKILSRIRFANNLCAKSNPIYFFERISELYKNIYCGHYTYIIENYEYSLSSPIKCQKKSERLIEMVQAMQEIKKIMRPGTIKRFLVEV